MHFNVVVIGEGEERVAELLAPYNEALEVEETEEILSENYLVETCRIFNIDRDDIPRILSIVGPRSGVDERGIWRIVDYNRQGKWDYWSEIESGQVGTLLQDDYIPLAIVTPDGVWHSHDKPGIIGISVLPAAESKWIEEAREIRSRYFNEKATLVDCHV